MQVKKTKKKFNPFNRLPINPPKDFRQPYRLPDSKFRMIPR